MNWIHRTGYAPAYEHVGGVLVVDTAGKARIPTRQPDDAGEVRGWRAGCACGWSGIKTYSRDRFPSPTGKPPAEVDGSSTRTGAWAEWRHHLFAAVPELIVADAINVALRPVGSVLTHPTVAAVVAVARERGVSWTSIAAAANVTPREARWAWAQPPVSRRSSTLGHRGPRRVAAEREEPPHHRRSAGVTRRPSASPAAGC
jgi:hypothetical protein